MSFTLSRDVGQEDARAKSNRYLKGVKFEHEHFEFDHTQFLVDANYIGDPPDCQVSIANLNDNADENFLMNQFTNRLGKVKTLEIVRNPNTKQHLGLAKVQFEEVRVARLCVEYYDGKGIMGTPVSVFIDKKFALIEELKQDKLQPKPPMTTQKTPTLLPSQPPLQPNIIASNLPFNPILVSQPTLPPQQLLQKVNSLGKPPIPSSYSSDYPTTPSSIGFSTTPSLSATPDSTPGRPRLDDRLASWKKFNSPVVSQFPATYSSLSLNETNHDYANSSHYQSQLNINPLKVLDKQRPELNNHRGHDNNYSSNHCQNHKEPYHKYNSGINNKSDRYQSESNSKDQPIEPEIKQPLKIELNEKEITEVVLPYCYKKFYRELENNLLETIFKKLRETYGFELLDKAMAAYRNEQEAKKREEDERKRQGLIEKQFKFLEFKFLNSNRTTRPAEAPKRRAHVLRERTSEFSLPQDNRKRDHSDLRRVNRSSAYVSEPERRGSHNTSIDSDTSDSESHSTVSSSTSSSSSISQSCSRSSSPSSSRSRSSSSCSSRSDRFFSSRHSARFDAKLKKESTNQSQNLRGHQDSKTESPATIDDERIAIDAMLMMRGLVNEQPQDHREDINITSDFIDDSIEDISEPLKLTGKKRKRTVKLVGVASEYRSAKRFASSKVIGKHDENIENALLDDENLIEPEAEVKFTFQPRSQLEKERMLNDLFGTLNEEDVEYLKMVHDKEGYKTKREDQVDINIPFGSEHTNKAHLYPRKHMIEGKATEGHPKWWRGCSRCDVIEVSEKGKIENEDLNYEDLTRAPIKSHVIQAATSSRRDQRGDQRRIAVLNPEIDAELMKKFTTITNTLQMRAKNLRFSRSKIHKWGLFACEKIASGDAVIEYVGEKIRPSLADHREKVVYTNLRMHDGSSYFFRVDYDVIDATLKGNKARFINHSCNPNCIAKVIKHDNKTNSIVIYAKQVIQEDEEITYDYKFPREETVDKIRCNCRAPNCQKWLN